MYRERKKRRAGQQSAEVLGGKRRRLVPPVGKYIRSHQHYQCECYHFGVSYSYHLRLYSRTVLNSIKQSCKTATST